MSITKTPLARSSSDVGPLSGRRSRSTSSPRSDSARAISTYSTGPTLGGPHHGSVEELAEPALLALLLVVALLVPLLVLLVALLRLPYCCCGGGWGAACGAAWPRERSMILSSSPRSSHTPRQVGQ